RIQTVACAHADRVALTADISVPYFFGMSLRNARPSLSLRCPGFFFSGLPPTYNQPSSSSFFLSPCAFATALDRVYPPVRHMTPHPASSSSRLSICATPAAVASCSQRGTFSLWRILATTAISNGARSGLDDGFSSP